jgi:hypothetical protein
MESMRPTSTAKFRSSHSFGAGALLGAFLSRRKKKQKDAVEAAREWLEAAYAQLAQKLPQLAEKLAHAKKPSVPRCQAAFLDQAQQVAKKLKWW